VLLLSVLLHEIGHAVAARAGGYRVTSLGIGTGPPLLLFRLPRTGTLVYVCRFALSFSGVTWVYNPKGVSSRAADVLLACGGSLTNMLVALVAAALLASFERQQVPFLTVWVPAVVTLLVNSVLALLFFLPRRSSSAEQGVLPSDGLQVLATLFPARFVAAAPAMSRPHCGPCDSDAISGRVLATTPCSVSR
jgi:membrane-associated protease RseP (regulator of RpoE activity)